MANLNALEGKSVSQMTDDELLARLSELRKSRRTIKESAKATKSVERSTRAKNEAKKVKSGLAALSVEDMDKLIAELKGMK